MKSWVEYMKSHGDNKYLWNTGKYLEDWLGLDAKEGSYKGAVADIYTIRYLHHQVNRPTNNS